MSTVAQAKSAIYNRLASAPTFHPASADLFTDFTIQSGDVITVNSGSDSYDVPIYGMKMKWNGDSKVSVQSTGNEKRDSLEKMIQNASSGGGGGGGGYRQQKKRQERIEFIVGIDENGDLYVNNPGYIVLAINEANESEAHINADHINIDASTNFHSLAGSIEYDENGQLVIHDAGGVVVQRTESGVTSQFGVFDEGNLTGGVMVTKINGQTTLKLSADVIDIDGIVTALAAKAIGVGSLTVEGATEFLGTVYAEATITAEEAIRSNTGFNVGGTSILLSDASVNQAGDTLTITKVDGSTVTFNKATSISSSNFSYNRTGSIAGRKNVGSVSKSSLSGNTYILFTMTAGGTTQGFYITVNA